jgi:uncharacterized protein (TIGR02996 family)
MSLEQALLDDIIANLDDDTPRLVYADLLEEHGQDQTAQFIRLQVERARLPDWEPRAFELDAALAELWPHHPTTIPVPKWARWVEYRRGFPSSAIVLSPEAMSDKSPTTLDDVTLIGGGWDWRAARRWALLGQVRALRLPAWGPEDSAPPPLQPALRDADSLAALLDAREMPHLRDLDLGAYPHRQGWMELPRGSYSRELLRNQEVGRPLWESGRVAVRVLNSSGLLPQLEGLRLTRLNLGEEGGLALASCRMPALRRLDLLDTGPGQGALAALAPAFEKLASLRVNGVDVAGPLQGSVFLSELEELDLTGGRFNAYQWADVVAFGRLRALVLDLIDFQATFWPTSLPSSLRLLSLRRCQLDGLAMLRMAEWPGLNGVTHLDLTDNYALAPRNLGDLAKSPYRGSLRCLSLRRFRDDADSRLVNAQFGGGCRFVL